MSQGGPPPFSLGADPIPGESLPGYIVRLAARVRKSDAGRLAGMVGLRQPGSAFLAADLRELARRAGTQVSALEAIAYRPAGRLAHHFFLGGVVNREFIDVSRRRACPRCLAQSAHHRAVWDFALVTACPDHGIRLLDRCPACGRPLGWLRANLGRCRCTADLTAFTGSPTATEEADADRDVVSLVGAQQLEWLPAAVAGCDRADLVRLLMCLGMFITAWHRERRIETLVAAGPDSVARVVIAGLDAVKRWPGPVHAYLAEQRATAGERRGRYGARKTLGAFYDWLTLMEAGAVKTALAEATRQFVERDPQLSRRTHRSRLVGLSAKAPGGAVALVDAARRVGRSGETVKRMMATGMLPTAVSEGRGVPMVLDGNEVEALAARLRGSVTLVELARILGVSRARTRRLVEAGLLTPIQRAGAEDWAKWAFEASEVDGFLARLCRPAEPQSPSRTVGFNYVAEVLRRRGVDLDRVVGLVPEGGLKVVGLDEAETGLQRLRFASDDVRALCERLDEGPTMTIEAAAGRLGLKWHVVANLVRAGLLEVVDGRVATASVDRFAADHVTGADLARSWRTSPRSLARQLAANGVVPVVGPEVDGSRQNIYRRGDLTRGGAQDHD